MNSLALRPVLFGLLLASSGCASPNSDPMTHADNGARVHYLEIVTPEVDATCATYTELHGVAFGDPDPGLGNARTATLAGGGMIGVRAPMHASEEPVMRNYLLVDDIEKAAQAVVEAGGEIAHPPLEIPGHGKFAIYLQGGLQHALWQL